LNALPPYSRGIFFHFYLPTGAGKGVISQINPQAQKKRLELGWGHGSSGLVSTRPRIQIPVPPKKKKERLELPLP
jgi:hypothetical protein